MEDACEITRTISLSEHSSCQCHVWRSCCSLSGGHGPVFPLEAERIMSCIKRTALILSQASEPFQHFLCFSLSMKGNGHRNQMKQNELAGHNMQGSEGFLSLLRMITSYKVWLELSIQLTNNLSSFLIIQITPLLHVEGKLNFHRLLLCGPSPPQFVMHLSFLHYTVFLENKPNHCLQSRTPGSLLTGVSAR